MKSYIDVFGSIFICQENPNESDALINHLLSLEQISIDNTFHKSLKMMLKQIRERNLPINPNATLLIKKYFVASRRARINENLKGTKLITAFVVVVSKGTFSNFRECFIKS